MATELECVLPQTAFCCVVFLWAKELNAKNIHREMFPVYSGKCLSCREVHNSAEKRGKRFAVEHVETDVAEITVKRLLCCVFRCTGKGMGQMYHSGG
jgi:hypothetical protein